MKIQSEKFYTPTEISQVEGLLSAGNPSTRRQMLLRHIRDGRIEAINLGGDGKPRYVVQGKNLLKYVKRYVTPGEYEKK